MKDGSDIKHRPAHINPNLWNGKFLFLCVLVSFYLFFSLTFLSFVPKIAAYMRGHTNRFKSWKGEVHHHSSQCLQAPITLMVRVHGVVFGTLPSTGRLTNTGYDVLQPCSTSWLHLIELAPLVDCLVPHLKTFLYHENTLPKCVSAQLITQTMDGKHGKVQLC